MDHKSILKIGIKYGVFLGLGFCLYTTLMWLTNLDTTYLNIGQYLDMFIILLPLLLIYVGIKKFRKQGAKLTVLNRIYLALVIGVISALIYEPFLYYYHNVINPDWFDSVLSLKQESLKDQGQSREEIDRVLTTLSEQNAARSGMFSAFIASAIVIPFLGALLSFLFVRNKK